MNEYLTTTQKQRLAELSATGAELNAAFADKAKRDAFFKEKEKFHIEQNRRRISELLEENRRPLLLDIEDALSGWLMREQGFTKVATPTIITADMLSRMTVDAAHPLAEQVFWLEGNRCLRPMLAPNLYELMGRLRKITRRPVRIFECGSCFRKESQGSRHLNEFTMLNLVELAGVENGSQMQRLTDLARGTMTALDITDYELVIESSEVYGETLDIVVNGEELASGAYGPHPLDDNWQISAPWVGIGFGLERIVMAKTGYRHIKSVGRSLGYIDGARLNL
jgi:phenylalanyl-tRNA synthetase alpha chain